MMPGLRAWLPVILGALLVGAIGVTHTMAYRAGREHEKNAQAAELLVANQRAEKAERALRDKTGEIDLDDRIKQSALDQRLIVNLASPQPVRLCEPSGASDPADSAAAGRSDGAGDAGHVLQAGPDIGPALHVYGRDCERIRQKLTALQEWAELVTASPEGRPGT